MIQFDENFVDIIFYDEDLGVLGTKSDLKFLLDLKDLLLDNKLFISFFNYTDFSIRYHINSHMTIICCKEEWRDSLEKYDSVGGVIDKFLEIVENESLYLY